MIGKYKDTMKWEIVIIKACLTEVQIFIILFSQKWCNATATNIWKSFKDLANIREVGDKQGKSLQTKRQY